MYRSVSNTNIRENNYLWYMGSKNRISKDLAPVIQSYVETSDGYLEPFVGGANMIDKIQCGNKIGYDSHRYLIALLKKVQISIDDIPDIISEEEYRTVKENKDSYEDWYVGLVGFCATFGAKWFGGYARSKKDKFKGEKSSLAIKNLKLQSSKLKDIDFNCIDFRDIGDEIKNYVIYCDIPYRRTTKYSTHEFPYDDFYEWTKKMAVNNIVLISEYNMPNEFEKIWMKKSKVGFDSTRISGDIANERVENLYILKIDEFEDMTA